MGTSKRSVATRDAVADVGAGEPLIAAGNVEEVVARVRRRWGPDIGERVQRILSEPGSLNCKTESGVIREARVERGKVDREAGHNFRLMRATR
jgi:hypothetical protein